MLCNYASWCFSLLSIFHKLRQPLSAPGVFTLHAVSYPSVTFISEIIVLIAEKVFVNLQLENCKFAIISMCKVRVSDDFVNVSQIEGEDLRIIPTPLYRSCSYQCPVPEFREEIFLAGQQGDLFLPSLLF